MTPEEREAVDRVTRVWGTAHDDEGVRHTLDPVTGEWLTDEELGREVVRREAARRILGSEVDTAALNESEGATGGTRFWTGFWTRRRRRASG